jgi:hypothetical protein
VKPGIFCNFIHKLRDFALAVFPVRPCDRRNTEMDKIQLWTEEYGGDERKFALDFRPEAFHLHQCATLRQTKY